MAGFLSIPAFWTGVILGYLDKSSKVNAQLILPAASNLKDYHSQKSWWFIAIKHKNMNFGFGFFFKQQWGQD